jgi:hypothetical protein
MGGPDYSLSGSRSDKRRQGERRATSKAIGLFEQPLAASQPGQQVATLMASQNTFPEIKGFDQ